jgi:hypothetical protein
LKVYRQNSFQCKLEAKERSTDGRNFFSVGKVKTCLYNFWQVLKVAELTVLFPKGERTPRCLSPFKRLLVLGEVGRTQKGCKTLFPGTGSMGVQIPPAGLWTLYKEAEYKYPST